MPRSVGARRPPRFFFAFLHGKLGERFEAIGASCCEALDEGCSTEQGVMTCVQQFGRSSWCGVGSP